MKRIAIRTLASLAFIGTAALPIRANDDPVHTYGSAFMNVADQYTACRVFTRLVAATNPTGAAKIDPNDLTDDQLEHIAGAANLCREDLVSAGYSAKVQFIPRWFLYTSCRTLRQRDGYDLLNFCAHAKNPG